jgi:hypothetical protein
MQKPLSHNVHPVWLAVSQTDLPVAAQTQAETDAHGSGCRY